MKFALLAGMVGFAMLGMSLGATPLGQAAVIVAALCGLGAFLHWASAIKRRDKYDLNSLREIHEHAENAIDESELEAYATTGRIVCLNCGSEYESRLGHCPRCGKGQYGSY